MINSGSSALIVRKTSRRTGQVGKDPKRTPTAVRPVIEAMEPRVLLSGRTISIEQVGQWGGVVNAVTIDGSRAYVCQGQNLLIVDVAQPSAPAEIGRVLLPDIAYGVSVSGDYAYIADGASSLQVVNVSNPVEPVLVHGAFSPSSWYSRSDARDVLIAGNCAYVADKSTGLLVLDIGDPAAPRLLGRESSRSFDAQCMDVSGNYAYLPTWEALQIIDIRDPAYPHIVGAYPTGSFGIRDISVSGNYAYVTGWSDLQVIDISNPAAPTLVNKDGLSGYGTYGVSASGHYAYVTDGSGLEIVDISDPEHLALAGKCDAVSGEDVTVSGSYAYVTDYWNGLKVVDITNPANVTIVGEYCTCTAGQARDMTVSGNYAYVTGQGLQVFDISDPAQPVLVGACDATWGLVRLSKSGNYACVTGPCFEIFDISDPAAPTPVGGCATESWDIRAATVSGNYVFAVYDSHVKAGYRSTLVVIDISNLTAPVIAGEADVATEAFGVSVSGDYAYLATPNGIQVINIRNPIAPALVSRFNPGSYGASGVSISGEYAYTAWDDGFRVIDISNPRTPSVVGTYRDQGEYWSVVSVVDNYAYVTGESNELFVFDISDPAAPALAGRYVTAGAIYGLSVAGNFAYIANNDNGLVTLHMAEQLPAGCALTDSHISENSPPHTLIGQIDVVDPDSADRTSAQLVFQSQGNINYFEFVDGYLRTTSSLDYEARQNYAVDIRTTDSRGLRVETVFAITVTDVPDFGLQGGKQQRLTIRDNDGDLVTFSLSGGAVGTIQPDQHLNLVGTTDKSVLSINVKIAKGGDGYYSLSGISADGMLKTISAPKVFVNGTIAVNTEGRYTGERAVAITLAGITDGSIDTHGTPIRSLNLLDWQDTDGVTDQLLASWTGVITVLGRKDNPKTTENEFLAGDWDADILISASKHGVAIGAIRVAGDIAWANLCASGKITSVYTGGALLDSRLAATDGIGSISVGQLLDSDILVGVEPGFAGRFAESADEFANTTASLNHLVVRGEVRPDAPTLPSVLNSNVSAPSIGAVSIANKQDRSGAMIHQLLA